MFAYHYAAFRTNRDGKAIWMDGIAHFEEPVITQNQYAQLKAVIAEQYDIPEKGLVLTNLSLIHQSAEDTAP